MSTASSSPATPPHSLGSGLANLRAKWGWIVALGVIYLIAGVLAFGSVFFATVVSVLFVGAMMIVAGVAEIINAFQFKTWGKFLFWLLLGALYVVAGFITFENPLLAAATLTLFLGIALVVSGIVRIFLAFGMNSAAPWGMVAISGLITLVLGVMILARWPVSSLYVLGIFLSVDLICAGVSWISMGMALKQRA
ncbi:MULTISPECIES: HdeD family acid-resistance protein [unclassified Bradyrhizobium]|uniref:HdeD family acid-resistance protein n=1 Tax=unclassified Bradyrhizobium TaxID=2631580 RepID=UPI001BA86992|nr:MULTISPECIES: HdeD family acid-resistance protein [unclassified Bradyrhizobium]MBR1204387.1 HdeD family acid-resistance protein [Bradyrhizobium sp. AUGA SZCCT0124]MBR1309727.1 HdeD family acid-resistance protein [Bradyrhizobium sp. AUGA SZCCT0051]MBR1339868.1 HdeD family acid-resistance protein [Bradyrhizobium sp. AUGA SZCCT0105]MBR1354475.1 HdeD family acid-resistance protein [Bradyrhizobium sp. AUGA SZCCT0045]